METYPADIFLLKVINKNTSEKRFNPRNQNHEKGTKQMICSLKHLIDFYVFETYIGCCCVKEFC